MPALTKEMITPGLHIWMTDGDTNTPLEFIVITGEVGSHSKLYISSLGTKYHQRYDGLNREAVYLGDMGVEGYKYDKRKCQVFTTKEELMESLK